jgi:tRNA A37 N6-isopentenylltransferase MiaA
MIHQLKINTVTVDQPKKNKNGKTYRKVSITTDDGRRMSTFCYFQNQPELNLEANKVYPLIVEQNGEWLNFKIAGKTDMLVQQVHGLVEEVKSLQGRIAILEGMKVEDKDLPEEPPQDEPF